MGGQQEISQLDEKLKVYIREKQKEVGSLEAKDSFRTLGDVGNGMCVLSRPWVQQLAAEEILGANSTDALGHIANKLKQYDAERNVLSRAHSEKLKGFISKKAEQLAVREIQKAMCIKDIDRIEVRLKTIFSGNVSSIFTKSSIPSEIKSEIKSKKQQIESALFRVGEPTSVESSSVMALEPASALGLYDAL